MSTLAEPNRLDYLDAVRAFALLLGIAFHASLSFMPIFLGWAVMDVSTGSVVTAFVHVSHSFRMELFFLVAGYFSHLSLHRKGGRAFLKSRLVRIGLPLVVGWFILRPLIVSGWVMGAASLQGEVRVGEGLRAGFQALASSLPAGLFTGSHLWFLYYLLLITAIALSFKALLGGRAASRRAATGLIDTCMDWLSRSKLQLLVLAAPTVACLWFMSSWSVDTPDQSLVPNLPVLALYCGFFGFGWALRRNASLIDRFARLSPMLWVAAVGSITATLSLSSMQFNPGSELYDIAHAAYATGYAIMMWSLVFITLGVFKQLVRKPNSFIRYLADASYWLYLVHLPIVVWLQVAVAELPLHWSIKLLGVTLATVAISLLIYDLTVRSTFIGKLLNGRRRERALLPARLPARVATGAAAARFR